jgi:type II secretory pathway pseudopilin PulG
MLIPWKDNKKGISTIEILIAVAIIALVFTSLLGLAAFSLKASLLTKETIQAKNIAQETLEAVRNFRDGTDWEDANGLKNILTGEANPYHPEKNGSVPPEWELVAGEENINGFTRKVIFYDVQRNGDDDIVESGGTNDDYTKKVKAVVSWQKRGEAHQTEIITYLTGWR